MKDFQQYCYAGTGFTEQMFQTDESVRLRVLHFKPGKGSPYPPVVMVVGLATVIESFRGIIGELTRDFEVYYVETREKTSSRLSGKVNFDIETVAGDITTIINLLELSTTQYILFGYSYSAAVIVEAYRHLEIKPICLLLLSPTPSFYYPHWSLPLIRIAVPFYWVLKPIAKWYLRNFIINRKEDNDMYLFTSHALDCADPRKLKNAILAIEGYEVWDKLNFIDCATLSVDTSRDGIHVHEDILKMADSIKGSTYVDLENNKRTHGAELVIVIRNYVKSLKSIPDSTKFLCRLEGLNSKDA
jgi:pimeloyl-ACP methyl ester carboxylesterase